MTKEQFSKGGKRALMLVSLLMLVVATFAVPAKPGLTRLLTLTDGTTINATLMGDEYLHYWLGEDGKAYQAVSKQERGLKGGSNAGDAVYQIFNLESAKKSAAERRNNANQQRVRRLAPSKVGNVGNIIGKKKGIIILVNFTDETFSATQSDFYNLANTVNYNSGKFKGSMRDYFYAQSEGQFELTFDVVGPYTVSHNCSYYGGNDSDGYDLRPGEMVKEAVQLANGDVNFANYDWDNDGYVDQVYVVYAGKGEADGGNDDTIWPHEWSLYSSTGSYITLDGKKIDTYACGGEQDGSTGETAGIGTMCHEFSHCLGYPDFYDTDYSGGQGMGYWDLMDSGSYNGNGYQPAGYTSYERWVAGWKTPIELEYTQTISNMAALQTTGSNTYIIYNKGNNNEYYLLENRQKTGWDTSLPGEGLLILHVDYSSSAWSNNTANDTPSHQRMTWIAADNNYQYTMYNGTKYYTTSGMATDPFPQGSVNAFGKSTTPAAKLYNKNSDDSYYLDSSVEDITQNSDGTVSFYFRGISNVALPVISPDEGRFTNDQTVTVTITAETGAAIYYTTNGDTPTAASTLYTAPFTLNATTTVKAIAVKDDEESGIATATYTFIDPLILADESLSFSAEAGSSETKQLTVLTEGLTQDVTLALTDANGVFSLSTNTISKSQEEETVNVTFSPTAAGNYSGTITLTSAGADPVTVSLSATATLSVPATPAGLTLSEVASTSLTASWSAVDGAESYVIDVVEGSSFTASSGEPVLESDFSDTTDWTLSGTGTYIGAGYYGSGSPSIKFDGTGDYAISPDFGSGTKLQFWALGNNGAGSTFTISGLVNDSWQDIETVTIAKGGATYEVNLPSGTSQVRFDFTKTVNCALDDVKVCGPSSSPVSVDGYPKSVGNVTSYAVTGLTSDTQYAVRVRAVNSGGNSDWSATATAATTIANPTDPTLAYYQNADGFQGSALKTAMSGIIYNRTEKSYDYLWTAFQSTDVRNNGKIWDMYSNATNYEPGGSAQGAEYAAEGDSYNREHSFPKSWFGGDVMPMYTDLHHIYPTDGFVNNKRANYPFGETDGTGQGSYQSIDGFSKLGTCTYPGYTGIVFEPADEYKGDFARTYFYMVTCYEEKLADWYAGNADGIRATIDGSTYPALTQWQLNMLMEWAKNDPVSEKETARNNAVYAIQNNRNPFIDYPGLQEYIWGICTNDIFDYDDYVEPVYSTPVTVPELAIGNITDNSADASWTACDGVTEYTLQLASDDQFSNGGGDSVELINEGFYDGTLPDDWTLDSGSLGGTYTTDGNYGSASPSLKLSNTVTFSTPILSNPTGISFWYKGNGNSFTSTFVVEQLVDGVWGEVGSASISGSAATFTHDLNPAATQVRFVFTKNSGNVAFDDVVINGTSSGSGSLISSTTVNGTNYTFTGLTPETTYFARVKGNAEWSNVEQFTTEPVTYVETAPAWTSNFPTTATVNVGDLYELADIASYVTGYPTPIITFTGDGNGEIKNGNFQFIPDATGDYTFTFTAANGINPDATATLTVTAVAEAPVLTASLGTDVAAIVGETVEFEVTATGIPTPAVMMDATEYGATFENGKFSFTPDAVGTYDFNFTAENIEGTDRLTVIITVSPAPVTVPELTVTDITDATALATWTECDGVTTYTLQLSTNEFAASSTILSEDFSGVSGTGTTAIANFDDVLQTEGWLGEKVFADNNAVRIGTSSAAGSLQTPLLTNIRPGSTVRVVWSSRRWPNDGETANVGISVDGGETFTDQTVTLTDDWQTYTNTFEVSASTAIIRWSTVGSSKKRFYLDDITITSVESVGDDVQEFTVSGTSYEFTGLEPETTYYARVKGNADWSNTEEFITEEAPAPGTLPFWFDTFPGTATVAVGEDFEFPNVSSYASGTPSPIIELASAPASVSSEDYSFDSESDYFLFTPKAPGNYEFVFRAENVLGSAFVTLTVTVNSVDITLADNATDNTSVIEEYNGATTNITLSGRTLYKDGEWNTICLPFDVTISESPLADAEARTLTAATLTGTHVELTFGNPELTLSAGVPYIIRWDANGSENLVEPTFVGVTINKSTEHQTLTFANDNVQFIGYYDAFHIDANDEDVYYLTSGNTFKHTAAGRTLYACRAYFRFSEAAKARQFVLNFGENGGTTTGILEVDNGTNTDDSTYDLLGRKVDGKQSTVRSTSGRLQGQNGKLRKGLYIKNGRKVVIK